MRRALQNALLALYRRTVNTGVLSTRAGKAAFEWAYWRYKSLIEAGEIDLLHRHVVAGGTVIDVGANIGFFTVRFARWAGPGGRVFAIEAEQANFDSLRARLARDGLASQVIAIRAAAAEKAGELRLAVNRYNPADHWLAESGQAVPAITLDALMRENQWPAVCLIKIDVQGAEMRVFAGARETLDRFHPALFVEVDDEGLRRAGSGARELIGWLESLGYRPHALEQGAVSAPLPLEQALERVRASGYTDFLFLFAQPLKAPA